MLSQLEYGIDELSSNLTPSKGSSKTSTGKMADLHT